MPFEEIKREWEKIKVEQNICTGSYGGWNKPSSLYKYTYTKYKPTLAF